VEWGSLIAIFKVGVRLAGEQQPAERLVSDLRRPVEAGPSVWLGAGVGRAVFQAGFDSRHITTLRGLDHRRDFSLGLKGGFCRRRFFRLRF